jgi:hypothetical protein
LTASFLLKIEKRTLLKMFTGVEYCNMLVGYEACDESAYTAVEACVARFASILFTDE